MTNKKSLLPLAPFEKILRDAGAKRVSKGGVREFVEWVEETARKNAEDINTIVQHSNKKTVTERDVKLAKALRK